MIRRPRLVFAKWQKIWLITRACLNFARWKLFGGKKLLCMGFALFFLELLGKNVDSRKVDPYVIKILRSDQYDFLRQLLLQFIQMVKQRLTHNRVQRVQILLQTFQIIRGEPREPPNQDLDQHENILNNFFRILRPLIQIMPDIIDFSPYLCPLGKKLIPSHTSCQFRYYLL